MTVSTATAPVVGTRYGRVGGAVRDGVAVFLGVPYAAAPVGPLRLRAPQPPQPWDGVRPATALGATPPCSGYVPPYDAILHQPTVDGEDWLTVNVWTPDPGAAGLPVMVWVHGGAFVNGSSAVPLYDGRSFARDGVVLVTMNYRLGVEGFALLPDAPANRGLLDQVAALEWVRDNIAAFGGDPGRVTLFGESAGAMSVTSLLAAPRARGLFARAITQSGSVQAAAAPEDAALVTARLGDELGLAATAATLAGVDHHEVVRAQRAVSLQMAQRPDPERYGASVLASMMAFVPVVDGDLLPEHPLRAIAGGAGADVPLLTGTTSQEFRFFLVPSGVAATVTDDGYATTLGAQGVPAAVSALYRANRPGEHPGDVLAAVLTDRYFRLPALAVVQARPRSASWVYEFAWQTTHLGLGAAHAMELPFVFDRLDADQVAGLTGPDAPQALADAMHGAWVAFATTGDPGWPAYDGARPVMVFDQDGSHPVHAPREDERAIWSRTG